MKNKVLFYVRGKAGGAAESEHYKSLFPDFDIVGSNYVSSLPWTAGAEIPTQARKNERKTQRSLTDL